MPTYPPTVNTVVNGEDVDSGVTNRPVNQLIARTDYLKDRLDALANALSVVTSFDLPVGDSVLSSQLVYYNATTGKYEQAIAELTAAGAPPVFTPTARNNVVGIATNIRGTPGSKYADIYLRGRVPASKITPANFLETTASFVPGEQLFLSATAGEEGRCSDNVPALRVSIGVFENDGSLILDPDTRSLGEDHIHYRFTLDPTKWLDLGGAFPLTGAVTFTALSQVVAGAGTLFLAEVSPGDAIRLDADGLYYQVDSVTSDTSLILTAPYAGVGGAGAGSKATGPWLYPGVELTPFPPIPFESTIMVVNGHVFEYDEEYTVDSSGVHLDIAAGPPTDDDLYDVQLFYTFPLGGSSPGVTSLKAGTPNVTVENCSPGGPPDTGDLKVSVIDSVSIITETLTSGRAVKELAVNPTTGEFEVYKGSVVERILGGGGIAVSGGGVGVITISTTGGSEQTRAIPNIVLRNAKETIQNLTSYIEFPKTVSAKFFAKIRLDDNINLTQSLKIIFEMLGDVSVTGTLVNAQFQMEYHVIDPSTSQSLNKTKQLAASTLDYPLPYTAYTVFPVTAFTLPGSELIAGGTLAFLIRRLHTTDTYTGNVGLVNALYRSVTL